MEDQSRFSEKWDFRRKETDFGDSSSDDNQNSKSFFNPKVVLDHDQPYHRSEAEAVAVAAEAVITERSAKTRKRRIKKDENETKKSKQVKRGRPKKIKEDNLMMNDIGKYMDTLLDDLKTSRESLLEWFKIEMSGSDQNIAPQPFLKKKTVEETPLKRAVKKRKSEKEKDDRNKSVEKCLEMVQSGQDHQVEKCVEIVQNGGDQVLELDCNVEPLETFSKSGQSGIGINYFHQHHQPQGQDQVEKCLEIAQNGQNQVQELDCNIVEPLETCWKSGQSSLGINYFNQHEHQHQQQQQKRQKSVMGSQTDKQMAKTARFKNPKSIVLAIKAQNLSKGQKKSGAKTIKNNISSSKNLVSRSETPKDHNFMIPFTPKLSSSSSSSFQSFPVPCSSLSSMLPSSASQGIASLPSNNNFQMRPIPQIPDLSEFQSGQGFVGNGYYPAAFQSNLITGLNFPVQVNSQQRENNNMFPGLRMDNGAIRFSGNFQPGNFPGADVSNRNNALPDYRTGSGR